MKQSKWNKFWQEHQEKSLLKVFFAKQFVKDFLLENEIDETSESEWLIALTLKVKRGDLSICPPINQKQWKQIEKNAKLRAKHIPLSQVFGTAEFFGLCFKVSSSVLTPRPETEELVCEAIQIVKKLSFPTPSVLDLCCGSGAIAIAIKKKCPNAIVTASDISLKALRIAKQNAKSNGCEVNFIKSDLFCSLPKDEKYHIIVSNPPYIKTCDLSTLSKEVILHEPVLALNGGVSGLTFYERIAEHVFDHLCPSGSLLLEIGNQQSEEVEKNFKNVFEQVVTLSDISGNPRMVICSKQKEII